MSAPNSAQPGAKRGTNKPAKSATAKFTAEE